MARFIRSAVQFGRYVAQRFAEEARASAGRLTHLREQALSIHHGEVVTDSGRRLSADLLVLAISHPPPSLPTLTMPFATHPALIANPWRAGVLEAIAPEASVAIVGTGLTMADTVATLTRLGHRGPITAFSRRGLLSRSNLSGSGDPWPGEYDRGSLRQRLRQIREDIARAEQQGLAWQVVMDAVRNQGQRIWQGLTVADRQRFLRHLRSYWDVHRYRIAPQVAGVIEQRQRDGSLRVLAARLTALEGDAQRLTLTLALRYGEAQRVSADHVILTTGPAHGALTDSQPLLRQLSQDGLIRADAFGLGLDVDLRSRAIGREGQANPKLLVSGPAARARFGELMGLPQVADHAADVAAEALQTLGVKQSVRCPAF
ncbi:FAD-dependent oxidoreductase [Klebsiella oxytoca]|nr:FAD-dependent oxidoreductase [Klebsiella oxytoca]